MSRSVLLQLARDSVLEVFQAQRVIDKTSLLKEHPLLAQNIPNKITLYLEGETRGVSSVDGVPLLDGIVYNAKKATFEDTKYPIITFSEYLRCELEIVLYTSDGVLSERDKPILEG